MRQNREDIYQAGRFGSFKVLRTGGKHAEALLKALLPDPDRLMAEGEVAHSERYGGATETVGCCLEGKHLLLKRYNRLNLGYSLKNFLRPSKARRSWWIGRKMRRLGVPTPEPLLCIEERSLGLLGRAYLVTPYVEGEGTLWSLWPQLLAEERLEALGELGVVIGGMHRNGILHGDLNWRNILVSRENDKWEIFLVDLDCSRHQRFGRLPVERDLGHFVRDLRRHRGATALEETFLRLWQENAGMPVPPIRTGEDHP